MTDTRQLVDFAADQDGVNFRDALYSSIHDKVTAHIEAKKQEVAQSLITPMQDNMAMAQDMTAQEIAAETSAETTEE